MEAADAEAAVTLHVLLQPPSPSLTHPPLQAHRGTAAAVPLCTGLFIGAQPAVGQRQQLRGPGESSAVCVCDGWVGGWVRGDGREGCWWLWWPEWQVRGQAVVACCCLVIKQQWGVARLEAEPGCACY